MKKYYLHDGKRQKGPYSIEQLKKMNIKPDSMVWHEGMDEWSAAATIEELKSVPPPLNKNAPPPFPKKPSKISPVLKFVMPFVCVVIILFGLFKFNWFGIEDVPEAATKVKIEEQIDKEVDQKVKANLEKEVDKKLKKDAQIKKRKKEADTKKFFQDKFRNFIKTQTNSYSKDELFGGIWDLQVGCSNRTPYPLELVEVTVAYFKTDQSLFKSEKVYFYNVATNSNPYKNAPNSNKGTLVRTFVSKLVCKGLDMNRTFN